MSSGQGTAGGLLPDQELQDLQRFFSQYSLNLNCWINCPEWSLLDIELSPCWVHSNRHGCPAAHGESRGIFSLSRDTSCFCLAWFLRSALSAGARVG